MHNHRLRKHKLPTKYCQTLTNWPSLILINSERSINNYFYPTMKNVYSIINQPVSLVNQQSTSIKLQPQPSSLAKYPLPTRNGQPVSTITGQHPPTTTAPCQVAIPTIDHLASANRYHHQPSWFITLSYASNQPFTTTHHQNSQTGLTAVFPSSHHQPKVIDQTNHGCQPINQLWLALLTMAIQNHHQAITTQPSTTTSHETFGEQPSSANHY